MVKRVLINVSHLAMITLILFGLSGINAVFASDSATPQEVVDLVNKAKDFLAANGENGFAELNDKAGPWVLKDTYVFAFDCSQGTVVTHPIKPQLIGKNLMGLKDIKGNFFFVQMCEAAKRGNNEWVEYWWPKPGEKKPSRKISLLISVPGTPYQIAAGVYDDSISVDELNKLSK